jgi:hypothetical protein
MRLRILLPLLFVIFTFGITKASAQSCTPTGTSPSVTICMPTDGSSPTSPIHIQLATNDTATVDLLQVYYNQVKRWENHVSSADIFLAAGGSPDKITAVAHDTLGRWFQSSVNVTVTSFSFGCNFDQISAQGPRSVVICQPVDGEIHVSPIHLAWNATNPQSSHVPNATQVFIDGVSMFKTPPATRDGFAFNQTDLPLSVGRHRITVQAYDSAGAYKSTIYMHVSKIYQGCEPPSVLPAVELCNPTDGENVSGIIHFQASAAAGTGIKEMQEFVDNNLVLTSFHAWVDNAVNASPGQHTVTVKATDYSGNTFQRSGTVKVQ